jgi:hypothetical protein
MRRRGRSYANIVIVTLALSAFAATTARAELKRQEVEYKHGDTTLLGYLVWDDAAGSGSGKRPGVVVVHEWMGHND